MEDKVTIDLDEIKKIIFHYKFRLLAIILLLSLLAMGIAFLLPKQYESTVLIRAKSPKGSGFSLQTSAFAMLSGNANSVTQSYIEMMKSRSVLDPIIEKLDLPDKDKVDNNGFAKNNLRIQSTKGTDLVEITGIGRTPEEAQTISNDVISSFQQLLTKMNQSEQSGMLRFLQGRLDTAKQAMEQAEKELEGFRQQEKIFVPDLQTKSALEQVIAYDKKLAEVDVQNTIGQAKLQGINEQLQKQNIAISTYNIADNSAIQQIRSQIINKQMAMVEIEQRFTDKHPNVILAKKEIEELNNKLKDEVEKSIQAGSTSLNSIHSSLLSQKVTMETEILVGQAMAEAIRAKKAENEQKISRLSTEGITYVGLERKVAISREVYTMLVKNYEQTRIQEAMENMDIQIIDQANLPKRPSAPKKMLITIIGGMIGVIISILYVFILYKRTARNSGKMLNI